MEPDIPDNPSPLTQIAEGMRVIDADGVEVGMVDLVRLSDPDAVTVQAPVGGIGPSDLPDVDGTEEPDVPADVAARLLRSGYLKVDGEEPFDVAVYVGADQIADVSDSLVQLAVGMEDLIPEQ
ncbi:MAG TPA: hypothetical protein VFX61_10600 [Micromonosporaceae bacterium]|nr:hypothetical protein [Micromonosporaceae bacterium]